VNLSKPLYRVRDLLRTPFPRELGAVDALRFAEEPMIKKVSSGYRVLSEKGKNLGGPYKTKKEAEKRLKQVEFFKHKRG
jgi:hypothetical protein